MLAWLQDHVPAPRLQHILRVEALAAEWAGIHGLQAEDAAHAGLLHDLAKYFPSQRLLELARQGNIPIDAVTLAHPHLLHADVSALIAHQTFGVENPQILEAIRDHTLGRPGMGPLSCVVFLADALEPGRGHTPELEALRHLVPKDLDAATWKTCDLLLQSLLGHPRLVHPRTLETRNWALQRTLAATGMAK